MINDGEITNKQQMAGGQWTTGYGDREKRKMITTTMD
jgi:hypothetical protein